MKNDRVESRAKIALIERNGFEINRRRSEEILRFCACSLFLVFVFSFLYRILEAAVKGSTRIDNPIPVES